MFPGSIVEFGIQDIISGFLPINVATLLKLNNLWFRKSPATKVPKQNSVDPSSSNPLESNTEADNKQNHKLGRELLPNLCSLQQIQNPTLLMMMVRMGERHPLGTNAMAVLVTPKIWIAYLCKNWRVMLQTRLRRLQNQ